MKPSKTIGQGMVILAMVLLLTSFAYGMGIAPSSKEIIYEPGRTETVMMKIVNTEGYPYDAFLYVEGPLKEYITLNDELVSFKEGEKERIISYTITMPMTTETKGLIETEIIVRQIPRKDSKAGATISASLAGSHKVKLMVPFTGKYLEAKLFIGNFKKGKPSNFAIEAKNLGEEALGSVKVQIEILGPFDNLLATLRSDEHAMKSKEVKTISVPWTPQLGAGRYTAVATITYDGKEIIDRHTFTIGESTLSIDSISVDNFKLGGIAKFAMAISSNWNLPIDEIYADTSVKDSSGKVYTTYKTAETFLDPFGKQVLDAFWDTSKVLAGKYQLEINLHYLEKSSIEIFDIFVDESEISTTPTGKVTVEKGEEEKDSTLIRAVYILMFLVIGLIIFNVVMFYRRKKQQSY